MAGDPCPMHKHFHTILGVMDAQEPLLSCEHHTRTSVLIRFICLLMQMCHKQTHLGTHVFGYKVEHMHSHTGKHMLQIYSSLVSSSTRNYSRAMGLASVELLMIQWYSSKTSMSEYGFTAGLGITTLYRAKCKARNHELISSL